MILSLRMRSMNCFPAENGSCLVDDQLNKRFGCMYIKSFSYISHE